jgi:galactokinase
MAYPVAADRLRGYFARHYGRSPQVAWHAPGRINIIGEHTDYNGGFALPMAIREGVMVCAASRSDNRLVLISRQAAIATVQLDDMTPGAPTGWAAYPAGVAWALQQAGHPIQGASIAIDADLPAGAGLSSSAALECAVGLALAELSGATVPRTELIRITHLAENEFVGVPAGIMDQSASLLGLAGHALLLDCRTGRATPVPVDLAAAGRCLLIIDTQTRHALDDGRYADRRRECEAAARTLAVRSLREVTG